MLANKRLLGLNVAVVPLYETDPSTEIVPCLSVKVEEVMVHGFMGTLNVAVTVLLRTTCVAPFAGSVEITTGAVANVVNLQTYLLATGTPATFFAPVVMVPV